MWRSLAELCVCVVACSFCLQLLQAGKLAMAATHSLTVGGFEQLLNLSQSLAELCVSVVASCPAHSYCRQAN
jgi:hypothetical protein